MLAAMRQDHDRAGAAPSGLTLIVTKLRAPAVRDELVPRHRLVERLISARSHRLTLVDAPAGWGKTTLLAEWRSSPDEPRPFAWVSLDSADSDPVRFWTYVIEALRMVEPELGAVPLATLRTPGTSVLRDVLPQLINQLATAPGGKVLVLDDYHLVGSDDIHQAIGVLVERLPASLHLAIATRSDPPLPLARMRARGELLEIRADQLRFSEPETAALLNDALGLGLADADVARLRQRTEGWAAGLYLAALSLRDRADAGGFIEAFAGDDRHVVDYLGGEVLAGQPPQTRAFLLQTSILERLCGPLCDAVTGRADSAVKLEEIERDNLFLVPLDSTRRWYRYHHLFGELLRHELRRSEPELVATLHRRASAWHRDAGSPHEAVHHAIGAGDVEEAAELIARWWLWCFNRGELATVEGWLDALPPQTVTGDPRLAVARVWLALDAGRLDEAERWLGDAERGGAAGRARDGAGAPSAGIALLRALHRFKTGDVGQALLTARRAVELEPEAPPFWRTVAACVIGVTRYWSGDAGEAHGALHDALRLADGDGNRLAASYTLGYLAAIQADRGAPGEAGSLLERAASLVRDDAGVGEHFTAMMVHLTRSGRLQRQGRLAAAAEEAARGVELARRGAGQVELGYALLTLAELRHAQGDAEQAGSLLLESRRTVDGCADPGILAGLVAAAEQRVDRARRGRAGTAASAGERLTERELAVLRLLPSGMSQREIGAALFLSQNTVKTHTRGIYRKLRASSRSEAVARARTAGLL
jgi:LuxR family transcriptional regulator, maltose regulon positive regulatory protein